LLKPIYAHYTEKPHYLKQNRGKGARLLDFHRKGGIEGERREDIRALIFKGVFD